jgi:hypothetical protein
VTLADTSARSIPPTYRALNPALSVECLAEALQRPLERSEAAEAIRALIDSITLTPGEKRGQLDATLHGDLGAILE